MKSKRHCVALFAVLGACLLATRLPAQNVLSIGRGAAAVGDVANVPLQLGADQEVQGLVMVFEWDQRFALGVDLSPAEGPGEALEEADLVVKRVEPNFMILSVVMDLDGMGAEAIPAGQDQTVGTAQLRCTCDTTKCGLEVPLVLVDGIHAAQDGGPVLDNLIVVGGRSIGEDDGLVKQNGALGCGAAPPGPAVTCGAAPGEIAPAQGAAGESVGVCYYYRMPPNGQGDGSDEIQGFSLSVSYDCNLTCDEGSLNLAGSALEAANAEFVELHCDNNPNDGDGCEMIVGALVDANPPFELRTLPPSEEFRLLFCVNYVIAEGATCGDCLSVEFVDDLNGRGNVSTKNLASINFVERPFATTNCEVCVVGKEVDFLRGDCNFNRAVNIADAASIAGFLFPGDPARRFDPPCLDACDADDTGSVILTDVIFLLNYLFVPGSATPPLPGPVNAGPDPTPDDIGCAGGDPTCP